MTTPTPEQFMALPSDPDEDLEPLTLDTLEQSLSRMAAALDQIAEQGRPAGACDHTPFADSIAELQAELAEVEALHDAKQTMIEEALKVCKPSVSKLANAVRAVLEPVVAPPESGEHNNDHDAPPADDASVEEWRAFAASRGHNAETMDCLNRSQIRTLLGIAPPEAK